MPPPPSPPQPDATPPAESQTPPASPSQNAPTVPKTERTPKPPSQTKPRPQSQAEPQAEPQTQTQAKPTPVIPDQPGQWHPLEAFFGFLVPGLGHVLIGERNRGFIVGGTIIALFLIGVLVGGIGVVDRSDRYAPYLRTGQLFLGPSYAADWARKSFMTPMQNPPGYQDPDAQDDLNPDAFGDPEVPVWTGDDASYTDGPASARASDGHASPLKASDPGIAYEPTFGRMEEQGILFTSIAGLLNLLAVIDIVFRNQRYDGTPHRAPYVPRFDVTQTKPTRKEESDA